MTAKKVYIVGIGHKPLDERCRPILGAADVILASPRLLEVFQKYADYPEVKGKVKIIDRVGETLDYIERKRGEESIVLLGSGDPMFHGIGRQVIARCGREEVEVFPDLSSIQVAFARIRERWDDAFLMSLHGGLIPGKGLRAYSLADLPSLLAYHGKIAILTDSVNNPAAIAETFLALPALPPVKIFVCEKLGYGEEEIITSGAPEEIAGKTFSDLNVVILLRSHAGEEGPDRGSETYKKPPSAAARFGLTEKEFSHSRGLITKDEVRAITLHKLRLPSKGVLWDVGAGSGSLSIEAARLFPGLAVFAVERDDEQVSHMVQNKRQFDLFNMEIVKGEAPYALDSLPDPDRVFVGGSGGSLAAIIAATGERMRAGTIVINGVTLETVDEAVRGLEARGFQIDLSQVIVSRLQELGERRYLKALNPVFIIRGEKP